MKKKNQRNFSEYEIPGELSEGLLKDRKTIMMRLCLLKLPERIRNVIHLKTFKKMYGYEILRLSTQNEMTNIFNRIKSNKKK